MAPKTGVHGLKGPESKNTKKAKTPKATGVHTLGGPQTAATATPKGSSSAKKANTLSEMRADEHERRPSKRAKLAAQDNEDYVDDPADAVAADEDEDDLDEWGDGLWAAEFETDEEDLQDESDQEPFADDPDMEEDEIEQQNVHEYINEKGEFVSVPGEQVSEQEVAEKLRRDSTRVQHMHKLFKMIYRMNADAQEHKGKKDSELDDIVADEPGGRYDVIPDPTGDLLRVGPGVYRDVRTTDIYQRVKPGPKSRRRAEGKSVKHVSGSRAKKKIREAMRMAKDEAKAKKAKAAKAPKVNQNQL